MGHGMVGVGYDLYLGMRNIEERTAYFHKLLLQVGSEQVEIGVTESM